MKNILLCLLVASLLVFGCLGEQNPDQNQTSDVKNPSFTISSPTSGQVLTSASDGSDVVLQINTQNLVLKSPGGSAKTGEGHFRVTVDTNAPVTVTTKSYVMKSLAIGNHTVKVELLNNDRTSYSLSKVVSFTIQKQSTQYVPSHYVVNINDFSYSPVELTINTGDSVTFANVGSFPRSAVSYFGNVEQFNTQIIQPGTNVTLVFNQPGTFDYYSNNRPNVRATLIVKANN
ncbi:hypothetical protein HZC07_00690 [Candidatus Micrarchaeota archaeon]|nr:hypothetical protein [Candidatus Micrarchaeota archaeon]